MGRISSVGVGAMRAGKPSHRCVATWCAVSIGVLLSGCGGVTARVPSDGGGSEAGSDGASPDSMSADDVAVTECVTVGDCRGSAPLGGGCGNVA